MSVRDEASALILHIIAVAGILFMWASFSSWEYSTLLTISVAMQLLSLIFKVIYVRSLNKLTKELGISKLALALEGWSIACRLSTTLYFIGYLPVDRSGDYVYQAIDVVSILLSLWLSRYLSLHQKRMQPSARQWDSWDQLVPMVMAALFLASLGHGYANLRPLVDFVWMTGFLLGAFSVAPQLLVFLTCSRRNCWLFHAAFASAGAWTSSGLVMIKVVCWYDESYDSAFGLMMIVIYSWVFVLHADAVLNGQAGRVLSSAHKIFRLAANMRSARVSFDGGARAICKVFGPSLCVCAISMHKSPSENGYRPTLLSWMLITATAVGNFLYYTKDHRKQPIWKTTLRWIFKPSYYQTGIAMFSSCAGYITKLWSTSQGTILALKSTCKQQLMQRSTKFYIRDGDRLPRFRSQSLAAMRHGVTSWLNWSLAIAKAGNAYGRLFGPKQPYSLRALCKALSLLIPYFLLADHFLMAFYFFAFGCVSILILRPRMHVRVSAWRMPNKHPASIDEETKALTVCSVRECTSTGSGDALHEIATSGATAKAVEDNSDTTGLSGCRVQEDIATGGVTAHAVEANSDTTGLSGCRVQEDIATSGVTTGLSGCRIQEDARKTPCGDSNGDVVTDDALHHLCSVDDVREVGRNTMPKTNTTISNVSQSDHPANHDAHAFPDCKDLSPKCAVVHRSLRGRPLWSDICSDDDNE